MMDPQTPAVGNMKSLIIRHKYDAFGKYWAKYCYDLVKYSLIYWILIYSNICV